MIAIKQKFLKRTFPLYVEDCSFLSLFYQVVKKKKVIILREECNIVGLFQAGNNCISTLLSSPKFTKALFT